MSPKGFVMLHFYAFLVFMLSSSAAFAEDLPTIRAAVLKIGTVNWELTTIIENGLDTKYGFRLDVQHYADNGATRIAVAGGEADMAVADWIWLARQRAAGKDYVFLPYTLAVGGIVVAADSTAQTIADLDGQKLGIAGGPLDKSWLILRAYASEAYGFDLVTKSEQVYGAPPLIFRTALGGDLDGAVNYWHFLAKMKAAGMRELLSVKEAMQALGLDPDTPLVGYYFKEEFLGEHSGLAQAFYDASREAKEILRKSDDAWKNLRPVMDAQSDTEFIQLRRDWVAGIPARAPVNLNAAQDILTLMHRFGGEELLGGAVTLPDGLFADVD